VSKLLRGLQVVAIRPLRGFFFANTADDSGEGVLCWLDRPSIPAPRPHSMDRPASGGTPVAQRAMPAVGTPVVCEVVRGRNGRWFAVGWMTEAEWHAAGRPRPSAKG
jgi:hypothetical protein